MARKKLLEGRAGGGDLIDRIAGEAEGGRGSGDAGGVPAAGPARDAAVLPFPGTVPARAAAEYPLAHRKDGLFDVFAIGELEYRLGGVKPLFVTSLRVNIRAGNGERSYYDGLDLYIARARAAFAGAVHQALGAEPARVERDLVRMLEYLEGERDAALIKPGRESAAKMSEAEREAGMEFLRSPRLFDLVVEDLSALGYVGEDLNKQLLYVCASSRKLDDPISVLILSQSASGKSYLVDLVKRLMPPEDVIAVTSLSDQALNYIKDLTHKFLILGEAVHSEAVEYQIREMLSGKELSRLVVEKDPETGRMESRLIKMPVIVSSVMGSTSSRINPENASRCFVINADESLEQTGRIHRAQRLRRNLAGRKDGKAAVQRVVTRHRAAQRLLRKANIVNDFAPLLDFPTSLMRLRRDHERFLDLIDAVCFLRQYQKRTERDGDFSYIRCDVEDYRTAYRIMVEGVLTSTLRELPSGALSLYEAVRRWVRKEAAKTNLPPRELRFTQRQVREATGLGHTWVQGNLRVLADYEYLDVAHGGGERSRAYYTLRADEAIMGADLSMIPAPEAVAELLAAREKPREKK
jgi:energy-coupling factor transporter ATP-binding protein EcfA2